MAPPKQIKLLPTKELSQKFRLRLTSTNTVDIIVPSSSYKAGTMKISTTDIIDITDPSERRHCTPDAPHGTKYPDDHAFFVKCPCQPGSEAYRMEIIDGITLIFIPLQVPFHLFRQFSFCCHARWSPRVWYTPYRVFRFHGHFCVILSIILLNTSQWIVTAGWNSVLRGWSPNFSLKRLVILGADHERVVAFHPDCFQHLTTQGLKLCQARWLRIVLDAVDGE